MNNLTKMKIMKPANEVFEAVVDPEKIGNFWFTSSSARWEQGKTITLRYDEYDAQGDIQVLEIEDNRKIVYRWGYEDGGEGNVVTITLNESENGGTIVEVNEEGFDDNDEELLNQMIGNKEGWVYMLTCLKGYLEFGVSGLRAALVKPLYG
ncbi:hypothetical protein GE107_16065 [Cohnella sp. CFH 77786]|uniref:SRPBCC family protein n=1 Tax=Cohnella sp. CFH 77786 TaxID=2662265 RepID=UPI001C60D98D|nr:SRPBCC family protein [Cohnella sp. CFH 77786]MBW5447573.1 hypothetical protein [Cohnella sp. CFH 77786]